VSRRELAVLAACVAALALAACTSTSSAAPPTPTGRIASSSLSTPHAHTSYRPAIAYVSNAADVYRGAEIFCLRSPLSGTARYSVHSGRVSFTLDVHGLPAKTGVGLDWINNPARGYLVGAFTTGASGSYAGVANTFRAGEVRAIAIKFQRADGTGLPGIGKPCRA
jgi:hypothetical protein